MDAPSPEPPAAPAAAAPAPAGIIADAVAAVADAAAAVAGDPLASGSSSNSSDGAQDSLEFDSTAACVGLGGSAWTCFKKELPDSQIATRCGIEWERARASERGREFTKREQSIEEGEKENDAPLLSRLLLLLLLTHFFTPLLPPSSPLPPPQPTKHKQTNKQTKLLQSLALDSRGPRVPAPVLRPAAPDPDLQDEAVPAQPGERRGVSVFLSLSLSCPRKEKASNFFLLFSLCSHAFSLLFRSRTLSLRKHPTLFYPNSGSTLLLSPRAKRKKKTRETRGAKAATAPVAAAAGGEAAAAARSAPPSRASSAGSSPS